MPTINIKSNNIGVGEITTTPASLEINENWQVSGYFPIGSLFFNINNINPASYFGGTWERFGNGRVLVGVDENDTAFNTVEKENAASTKTVKLTASNMPQHSHQINYMADTVASGSIDIPLSRGNSGSTSSAYVSNSIGGGAAHNNLMPFATCYIWKRTA